MPKYSRPSSFLKAYQSLQEVLADRQLAALGDAYVNFVYSLALSGRKGKPEGKKVKGSTPAEALREAELRRVLPSRIDQHVISDAAEALVVYACPNDPLTLEENVQIPGDTGDLQNGFTMLLNRAKELIRLSRLFEVPH